MIVLKSQHAKWLSNSWLVADHPGGHAVIVDTGAPLEPIAQHIEALRLTVTHVLCTHHHEDHVLHNRSYRERYSCLVCAHAREAHLFGTLDRELLDGAEIMSGDLCIRALHVPGHTLGQLAFLVNDERVFTGDTLFRRSVGGTRAPGHTTLDDLKHSILEILLALPARTIVHPGHMDSTTVAEELADNPFVRLWRGLTSPLDEPCTALGEPARLLLSARDYDGGTKALVRFEDGRVDVVPGSRVMRS